jgi:hypothetical protein
MIVMEKIDSIIIITTYESIDMYDPVQLRSSQFFFAFFCHFENFDFELSSQDELLR